MSQSLSHTLHLALHRLPLALKWRLHRLYRPAILAASRHVTAPLSTQYGFDRGTPVGRYYVERFLAAHARDITGRVLEVKNSDYTRRFGIGVHVADVLDIRPDNPRATIVCDLAHADAIPDNTYDCFILTNTLQYVWEMRAALDHAYRILRPGGVLLATLPTVARLDSDEPVEYWRWTPLACERIFAEVFGKEQVTSETFGNARLGVAHLMGLACEELPRHVLAVCDPQFPLGVNVYAVKPRTSAPAERQGSQEPPDAGRPDAGRPDAGRPDAGRPDAIDTSAV